MNELNPDTTNVAEPKESIEDCPHCGRCPVCGRSNNHDYHHTNPPYTLFPCHPYYRYWDGDTWTYGLV